MLTYSLFDKTSDSFFFVLKKRVSNCFAKNNLQPFGNNGLLMKAILLLSTALRLNALDGNACYWQVKHHVNHHTNTNNEGTDSDIDAKPFLRLHKDQSLRSYHRFQHVYWVIFYGLSYLVWVFYDDFHLQRTQVHVFSDSSTPHAPGQNGILTI